MNHNYRSVWNEVSGTYIAAPESASRAGKKSSVCQGSGSSLCHTARTTLALSLLLSCATGALALPVGGTVVTGTAVIGTVGTTTTITQATQNAAINWLSFNITPSETVRFVQPDSNSIALNRVLGSDPSSIFGNLTANGKVFLVNPNGVLFGKTASINVGGLVASTRNISDADFMAGKYLFSGDSQAQILNQGSIHSEGGFVALLGANVDNQGVIAARLGSVALAAGDAVTLDLAGDGLLNVAVNQGAVNTLVSNGGLIQADGGNVLLTARSAGSLLQSAVNNTGVIQAQTLVTGKEGSIMLMGDMLTGTVRVGGTLDASAPQGGHGGFIETSAAYVKVAEDVRVTTLASAGRTGLWLVDPVDYTVAAAGGDITGAALSAQLDLTNVTLESSAGSVGTLGNVNVNDAVSWTQTTTLTLNAFNNVNIAAAVTGINGSVVANAGNNVNVSAATGTTTGSLTFRAVNDVAISAATTVVTGNLTAAGGRNVTVSAASTVTTGNMIFWGDNDGTGPGVAAGTVAITCGNNCLTITTGNLRIRFNPVSYATTAAEITAYDGNLTGAGVLDAKGWVFGRGDNKVYDGTTAATVSGLKPDTGGVAPAAVIGAVSNANFDTKNVGVNKLITYNSTFANATFDLFAPLGTTPGTYTTRANITQAALNVTANPDSKTYNGAPYTGGNGVTYANFVAGETAADLGGTLAYAGSSQGAVNVGSYAITPGGQTSTNYAISYVSGALNVTPAALTVTANDVSKAYGQVPTLSAFTAAGLVGGDTIGSVTETSPGTVATAPVAGSPYVITPTGATGGTFIPGNYTIAYVNGALTVTPVALTIAANNATKPFGQTVTLPVTAFTSTGLVNGDTIASVTETSPGTVATAPVAGSPYVITPTDATGGTFIPGNYTIAYVNGALTVTPAIVTVTANDATKPYGQTLTLPVTAFTTTGLLNGDTITSVTETSPGTAATAHVAGSPYPITPSNAAGSFVPGNYTLAYVNGRLTITPIPLTVTANDVTKTFGEAPVLSGFTTTPLVNGETVGSVTQTSAGQASTAAPGITYPITPSNATGGTFTPSDYAITYVDGALTVTKLPDFIPPGNPFEGPSVPPSVVPNTWIPVVVSPPRPVELATLVSPPVRPLPVAPTVRVEKPLVSPAPMPAVVPAPPPAEIYVAPHRPRKQDRN